MTQDQAAVIDFLSQPASYGVADAVVERVDTHCSIVFLVADRAYKLKRAIRYAALDYTSLALRRSACEAELRLNRRTAPALYLAVQPIGRDRTGALSFDAAGPAAEYVVVMRRFVQADLFDRLADAGRLTPALARQVGAATARLHRVAELTPGFGGQAALRRVIADNASELAKVAPALDGAAVSLLGAQATAALDRLGTLLDRRQAAGKVRRCHGDLRLANICLFAGKATLFDCIEFSDDVACIDVLYDLAFLLMDLLVRGCNELANVVFNAYLDDAPGSEGLCALPLFLALRAATRSYALAGSAGRQADPDHAARQRDLARHHIAAGLRFLAPPRPCLIALAGEDAPTRDAAAMRLAGSVEPVPGARRLPLPKSAGTVWHEADALLQAGISVLLEGRFDAAADCRRIAALAAHHSVQLHRLYLGATSPADDAAPWRRIGAAAVDLNQCGSAAAGLP